jgi:hypothetical protein
LTIQANQVGQALASDNPAIMHEALRIVARSQVLTHSLRQAERRITKTLGSVVNEQATKPLAARAAAGAGPRALSGEPEPPEQR